MRAWLVAALVAVLIPVCAGAVCGPTDSMHTGNDLAALLGCDSMYYPADAPAALALEVLTLLFVAIAVWLLVVPEVPRDRCTTRAWAPTGRPPDPPDDPMWARLII